MKNILIAALIQIQVFTYFLLGANLKDVTNQADLLLIYPKTFGQTLDQYVEWREQNGIKVFKAELDEIYSQFPSLYGDTASIMDFISFALNYWKSPKPKYILLAGNMKYVPSHMVIYVRPGTYKADTIYSDGPYWYDKYALDVKPDIAVGRLPAENAVSLKNMLSKTIRYEKDFEYLDYNYDNMMLVDKKDKELFESGAERLLSHSCPPNLKIKRIFRDPASKYYGEAKDFEVSVIKGTKFISVYGHGSPDAWLNERFINIEGINSMYFGNKPFIAFALSCEQNYDETSEKQLVPGLMSVDEGGAVAVVGCPGVHYYNTGEEIILKMIEKYYAGGKILGSIYLETKQELAYSKSFEIVNYSLVGDPCIKMPEKLITDPTDVSYTEDNGIKIYPNPFDKYLEINVPVCNGTINITITDITGRVVKEINTGYTSTAGNIYRWEPERLAKGIYFCRIISGNNVENHTIIYK